MTREVALTFVDGVGSVTGANFLLETEDARILVDCGMRQGSRYSEQENYEKFSYDPASIQVLIVTHAHIDHIGRIPKLVKDGFRGAIYSTPATHDLATIMFSDAVSILAEEARRDGHEPLYTEVEVNAALALWKTHEYHESFSIPGGFTVSFRDAGHILGSAMVTFSRNGKNLVFTGDLGNSPSPLLRDAEVVNDADYLVMESVYGDRQHEARDERTEMLRSVIERSIERGGTLLIPSFSVERTQILLYEINNLVESGKVKSIPVFLDSPLAIAATGIYKRFTKDFNEKTREQLKDDDIFSFPKLSFTLNQQESEAIERTGGPKIIIAGSGMSVGGRVLSHEERILPDKNAMVLLVGYQGVGTIGRQIQDGAKTVRIGNRGIPVRANVETIRGYSGHKDVDALVSFVEAGVSRLKRVYVVMGEPRASLFLTQRLRDYLGVDAIAPERSEREVLQM